MSMRVKTTYRAKCDYPDCPMEYDFWSTSEEIVTSEITNNEDWLCLVTSDNKPRFFCPQHLRYVQNSQYDWLTVFYDSDDPDKQTSLPALNQYYEDMGVLQPLPRPDCESSILAVLGTREVMDD